MGKVGLIEDDAVLRRMFRVSLAREGWEVIEYANCASARRGVPVDRPDLIVTDLRLPDGSGAALAAELKKTMPNLRMVAVSGVGDPDTHDGIAVLDDFLFKPVGPATLVSVVRRHLPANTPLAPSAGKRVLVVEDDPAAARLIRVRLQAAGHVVRLAGSSAEAMEALEREQPDVVVSDVVLPDQDGFSLARLIRSAWPTLPVVLQSSYFRGSTDQALARDAGAAVLLARQPDCADLLAQLDADLGSSPPEPTPAADTLRRFAARLHEQAKAARDLSFQSAISADQLAALGGVGEALEGVFDLEQLLTDTLERYLDAGALRLAATFVPERGRLVPAACATHVAVTRSELDHLWGQSELLDHVMALEEPLSLTPTETWRPPFPAMVLAPLRANGETLGVAVYGLESTDHATSARSFLLAAQTQLAALIAVSHTLNRLTRSEQRFRVLAEKQPTGVLSTDAAGVVDYANPAAKALLGTDTEGRSLHQLLGAPTALPHRCQRAGRTLELTGDSDHLVHPGIYSLADTTRERRLEQEAKRDPLTGLLNRRALIRAVTRDLDCHGTGALFFLDLDHFKAINDRDGHAAGDRALQAVGRALVDTARETDCVARIGGDEFVVWCPRVSTHTASTEIAARLGAALDATGVEVSVGCALAQPEHETPERLLHAADQAMYAVKQGRHGS